MISYKWKLKDGYPKQKDIKVFGTFLCGGGSSMGYKLAGCNHLGGVEIDSSLEDMYKTNHKPKYYYLQDIRDFVNRDDLPEELYNLDILDGSPPCSTFSVAGEREKGWNKKKVFREGQKAQRLDDLFFVWIQLVEKLKPKYAIAENVKGMLFGNAKAYTKRVVKKLNEIGYEVQIVLLKGSEIGLPQRRERVFFICRQKGLPAVDCTIEKQKEIPYKYIKNNEMFRPLGEVTYEYWTKRIPSDKCLADITQREYNKHSGFNHIFAKDDLVLPTITASIRPLKFDLPTYLTDEEVMLASSFPLDYDFKETDPGYVMGMSVPPLMMYVIADKVVKAIVKERKINV